MGKGSGEERTRKIITSFKGEKKWRVNRSENPYIHMLEEILNMNWNDETQSFQCNLTEKEF